MCADVRPLLPDWAADRLGPAARRAVEAHLTGCAACRAEADGWIALAGAADAFVALAGPPPAWRSPLEAQRERGGVIPMDSAAPRRRSRAVAAAVAALALAASVALAVVAGGPSPWRRGPARDAERAVRPAPALAPPTIVARAPTRVARLVAAESAAGAHPEGRNGHLTASFPAPGADPQTSLEPATLGPNAVPADLRHLRRPVRRVRRRGADARDALRAPFAADDGPAALGIGPAPSTPPLAPPATPAAPPDPAPTDPPPPAAAVVSGVVTGPDGFERAEVRIVALPVDRTEAPLGATTGADGAFTLVLPPGRWSIHAEAPTYLFAWPDGALRPWRLRRSTWRPARRPRRLPFVPGILRRDPRPRRRPDRRARGRRAGRCRGARHGAGRLQGLRRRRVPDADGRSAGRGQWGVARRGGDGLARAEPHVVGRRRRPRGGGLGGGVARARSGWDRHPAAGS
ncbi:MAG: zf-HC2 domain-containing protein [Anaerolineae bacterium]